MSLSNFQTYLIRNIVKPSCAPFLFNRLPCRLNCEPISYVLQQNRTLKSDLKIKWVRPEKTPSYMPAKSGDVQKLPTVDPNQYVLGFEQSKELRDADELVKRVFSVEFQPRRKTIEITKNMLVESVKQHAYDYSSMEVKIAKLTNAIRTHQELLGKPGNKPNLTIVQCKLMVDRRKKLLKHLRRWDYKRFEWLIDKLGIVYKPAPSQPSMVTRKDSLRKLTTKHCEEIKHKRLSEYRQYLESQQLGFLQEKLEKYKWIQKEENELGVPATITDEDINNVIKRIEELKVLRENTEVKSS